MSDEQKPAQAEPVVYTFKYDRHNKEFVAHSAYLEVCEELNHQKVLALGTALENRELKEQLEAAQKEIAELKLIISGKTFDDELLAERARADGYLKEAEQAFDLIMQLKARIQELEKALEFYERIGRECETGELVVDEGAVARKALGRE